jgi:hypothetical protein
VQPILGLIMGASETLSLAELKIDGIAMVEPDRKWGAGMPGKGEAAVPRAEKGEGSGAKRSGGKRKRKD